MASIKQVTYPELIAAKQGIQRDSFKKNPSILLFSYLSCDILWNMMWNKSEQIENNKDYPTFSRVCTRLLFFTVPIIISTGCQLIRSNELPEKSQIKEGVRELIAEEGMILGQGALSIFGTPKKVCVDYDRIEHSTVPGTQEGMSTTFGMILLEDEQSLFRSMELSNMTQLQATVFGKAKLSAKVKFALNQKISSTNRSVFLLATVKIKGRTSRLINPKINISTRKSLNGAQPAAIEKHISECGDEYMQAATEGAEFFGLIEVETKSESEKNKVTQSLTLSGVIGTGPKLENTTQLANTIEAATNTKTIRIRTLQIGGLREASTGPLTIKGMLEQAQELPSTIKNGKNMRVLTGYFADYFTIGLPIANEKLRGTLKNAASTIEGLSELLSRLRQQKRSIARVLKKPTGYQNPDIDKIKKLQTATNIAVRTLIISAKNCKANYLTCNFPRTLRLPAYKEPKKRGAIYSDDALREIEYSEGPESLHCFADIDNREIEYIISNIEVHYLEEGQLQVRIWRRRAFRLLSYPETYTISPYSVGEYYLKLLSKNRPLIRRGAHFLNSYVLANAKNPPDRMIKLKSCAHY